MCGIAGWVNWQQSLVGYIDVMRKMTETLAHRGPDEMNVKAFGKALLGHQRLAVIDLEGGRQPMQRTIGDRTYTLVYNGELYNTAALRKTLENRGYTFETTSDTEVLLAAYIEWQEACPTHLNGIFAFAVWCEEEESLFICRDRMGVKPLFYTERENEILFASEIKTLLKHPTIKPQVDLQGLKGLLSIGPSRIPGTTVFKNIIELKPAHYLKITPNEKKLVRYWDVSYHSHPHEEQETVEQVRTLLQTAIERQLVSDVPLCTFLSGGLDSSFITAVAAEQYRSNGKVLHTYSVDFEESDKFFQKNDFQVSQDAYWIQLMRDRFQTEHHEIILTQEAMVEALLEAMQLKDYPSMADIDSSLLLFCREMKKDFTVALSGECADELFGGYPWFFANTNYFPWIRSIKERDALLNNGWRDKLNLGGFLQETYDAAIAEVPDLYDKSKEGKERGELFYLNNMFFMQTLLERKDRMSMGASLEVRVPFADHELVEYVWNIPWDMKTAGGHEKGILRKAAEGLLPEEIVWRKKNPYPKTYHPAYTKAVQTLLAECLADSSSILYELFDHEQLQQLLATGGASFQKPWFGQLMAGPQLLAYFVQLHHWFKNYNVELV
ncbi:asparagine synthase (glutamine-hydrolyzing) [Lysinibacillus odysseyi]|uniref:asparagine synthase (glutamine-hydrolyzing) n=1 Tax=Lysinibacillus odysseyi 34hs-1 = NBRC 100172 TaxID=1220589 RepID=A0A0A3IU14_9BACI|nr:asparagine synthase (glutamine-hydrolyzing) [Lysinibacillus odysseyi]KGR88206.1 asparagine synthase [Lysinibacillus odysseyi 34hs-1 = NBRC 100172]